VLLRVSASFLSKDPDSEGRKRLVLHVSYERSQKNRREAIKRQGTTCAVRTFNFDQTYGYDYADGYIQIHHIKPLSEYEGKVDPETDLVPLCANCHAMAHSHGPQAERHRNLDRGAEGADREGERLGLLRQKRPRLRQHQRARFGSTLQDKTQIRRVYPRSSGKPTQRRFV